MRKVYSFIYSSLFFAGCIASFLFILYVIGFIFYLNHLNQPLPAIAHVPKKIFLFIPFVYLYKKKEVQEVIEKLEKILP